MTDEEKAAMVQFLGTVHAQAKKTDEAIVERSPSLPTISKNIQQELRNVLSSTVPQGTAVPGNYWSVPAVPIPQPNPEVQHVFAPPAQFHTPQPSSPQMEFDFSMSEKKELLDLLRRIDKNLTKLTTHLINDKQPSESKQAQPNKSLRFSSITK
jgi:hypothetical protein